MSNNTNAPELPPTEAVNFGSIERNGVVLALESLVTKKGIAQNTPFLNLVTTHTSLEDLIKFIDAESAKMTLQGELRRFCLSVSKRFTDKTTKVLDVEKIKEALRLMQVARITKGQLEDEFTRLSGALLELLDVAELSPEQMQGLLNTRTRMKAIKAQLAEMEKDGDASDDNSGN